MVETSSKAAMGAWVIVRPVQTQIWFSMGLAGLGVVAALGVALCFAAVVHALFVAPTNYPWVSLLGALVLTLLSLFLRLSAFNRSHFAAFRLETHLRTQLSVHLSRVSLGYMHTMGAAALAKVMMEDVKALHVFVADSSPLYARAYLSPVLTFVLMVYLDWRLALVAAGVLLLGVGAVALAWRGSDEVMRQYNEATERVGAAVVEYVQAMPVVRTFDLGTVTFRRYQQALEAYKEVVSHWYQNAGTASRLSQIILSPLPTLAALLWLGAWLYANEWLDPATWVAVLLVGTGMAEALLPLMSLKHLVAKTEMSIRRIQEVLNQPVLTMSSTETENVPTDSSVRFEQVSFRYAANEPEVLRDVSFTLTPGSVTAVVGPSGAGKTTVARLILRFWDVSAGCIQIGGVDVRDMSPDTLMRQVGFVFQDNFLFSDSIESNIRLGSSKATLGEVVAAAKAAQAHDFIMALPEGYQTPVGERGAWLSGGQRQRITVARAILQNKPILVLDEPTSFTDAENEAALIRALSNLMRGKTVLIVAHRLNTIQNVDQIAVFDQGRLVEMGAHKQLLQQQKTYARLWQCYQQAQQWTVKGEQQ